MKSTVLNKCFIAIVSLIFIFGVWVTNNVQAAEASDELILKVFILAGQSNMVGAGTVTPTTSHLDKNGGMGTLEYLVNDPAQGSTYDHLVTSNGDWGKRDDVWIVDLKRSGPLTVGYGANENHIGPEMQFGHVMGDYYENPVLIIKISWEGKSLYTDFRPPSSGSEAGPYYRMMLERIYEVLDNIGQFMPGYQGQGYEIAGFGWHQGWNDRIDQTANDAYQTNCVNLINDLRDEFQLSHMPFVLATTGMCGWNENHPRALSLMRAQLAVPEDKRLKNGNVRAVETRAFWHEADESPANQRYHWNRNAETYFLIGNDMGEAMIDILLSIPLPKKYKLTVDSGTSGSHRIKNINSPTTTLTMPSNAATASAIYRDANGTGSGDGPEGYTLCAKEPESYTFTQMVDVAYGAKGRFYYKYGVTGKITFNNATFGNPIPGVSKAGYYKAVTGSSFTLKVNSGSGSGDYRAGEIVTIWANEPPFGKVFDRWAINSGTPGIHDIRALYAKLLMPSNAVTVTATYRDKNSTGSDGPVGYTRCAREGQSYSFTEVVDVAYGAWGKYYFKYGVTGKITFNNTTFGDPNS
ncbi:MAG: sialate O-acetylesterase, partial [Gammaproteobacteria bacterium]|nr:sialate O-acetylesterase [Gammaproteobacteria bacterium]